MGHLNGILAWVGGNLNNNFKKKSNAQGVTRGGMLKLRLDRYISIRKTDCNMKWIEIYPVDSFNHRTNN